MEYIQGGELFNYIVSQSKVKERFARRFFRQCLSAVDYCHQNCVIHRDLKPENLLLDQYQNIKIVDFGFVNMFDPNDKLNTFCGSPFYASPEMVTAQEYVGPEVDIWSLGVVLFTMLSGHLPFQEENTAELCRRIASANFTIPDYFSESRSTHHSYLGSADLIKKMLTADPKKRITVEEIRNHSWTCEGYSGPPNAYIPERPALNMDSILDDDVLEKMRKYGFSAFSQKEKIIQPQSPAFSVYYLIKEHMEKKKMDFEVSKTVPVVPVTTNSPYGNLPTEAMRHTRKVSIGIPSFTISRMVSHSPNEMEASPPSPDSLSPPPTSRIAPVEFTINSDAGIQPLAALPKSRKFSMFQGWIKQKDDSPSSPNTMGRNSNRRTSIAEKTPGNSDLSLNIILGKFRRTSVVSRAGNFQDSCEISSNDSIAQKKLSTASGSIVGSTAEVHSYDGPRPSFQYNSTNSMIGEGFNGERPSIHIEDSYGQLADSDGRGPRPSFQSLSSQHNSLDFLTHFAGPRPSSQSINSIDYGGSNKRRPSTCSKYAVHNTGSQNSSGEDFNADNAWTPEADSKKGGSHHEYKKSPLEKRSSVSQGSHDVAPKERRRMSSFSNSLKPTSQNNINSSSKHDTTSVFLKPANMARQIVTPTSNSDNGNIYSQHSGLHLTEQISPFQSTPNSGFVSGPEDLTTTKQHKPKFFETLSSALKRFINSDSGKCENNGQIREIPETSLLNENSTSKKPIQDIMNEINRVVSANKLTIVWASAFKAQCSNEHTEFDAEICRVKNSDVYGIEFKRSKGSSWIYQSIVREITGQLLL